MFLELNNQAAKPKTRKEQLDIIFEDYEAKNNLVGFFDLALKVAKRNPKLWAEITSQ